MENSDQDSNTFFNVMVEDAVTEENGDLDTYYDVMIEDAVREDDEDHPPRVFEGDGEGSKQLLNDSDMADEESQSDGKEPEERNMVDSDGEDPVERCEYEMAMALEEFNDDHDGVRHNEYYVSGEDSDEEAARRERTRNFTSRHDGILFKGQQFFNKVAFKEAVLWYALKNQRNIRQIRYDKRKCSFICLGKAKNGSICGWKVYSSVRKGHTKWRIRSIGNGHSCEKSGDCKLLKVNAIARLFHDKIREEPVYFKPMKIEEAIFQRWGISASRNQTQAARVKVMNWLENEYDDQFRRLRDYRDEILLSNPGSSVQVECLRNEAGQDVFWRFYVCFSVLRNTWKETCRPLIGIDGTFLKGKVSGMLLVALGRDGDNRIYPVAWGIVEVENIENWVWFVKRIRHDLGLRDGSGYVIVSDRQKGLINAVSAELPGVEHRHCVRHIYDNLKAKFGKRDPMKKFIWDLAWSYNDAEYKERLQDIKNFDDEVYEYVVNSDPTSWCRAFYKLGSCCEDVENNSTESFNREKLFVPMLELIKSQAMTRIDKRQNKSQRHDGTLTPYAAEVLELEEDEAKDCKMLPSTGGMYQSTLEGCSHLVSLTHKTCSCRKWQIRGIPCEHAYGVILKKKLNVDEYVATWFHSDTWRRTYEVGITPSRGYKFWPQGTLPVSYPPNTEKKGYKEKKRKRGKNESPQKNKKPREEKRVMHCGVCGMVGHNARFHNKDKKGKDIEKKGKGTEKNKGKETKKPQKPKESEKQQKRTTKKKG